MALLEMKDTIKRCVPYPYTTGDRCVVKKSLRTTGTASGESSDVRHRSDAQVSRRTLECPSEDLRLLLRHWDPLRRMGGTEPSR